jgi:N utilization substance protein B
MGIRRKARECALQLLFQCEYSPPDTSESVESYWSAHPISPKIREYADSLVSGVLSNKEEIDELISRKADNWRLERITLVDRNILRIALFEFLYRPEIPKSVVINEALEVAKKYSSEDSAHFINGILDGVKLYPEGGK